MGKNKPPELGGQSVSSARAQLHKNLLWQVLQSHGENLCVFCQDLIEAEDFVVTHLKPWKGSGDKTLFWDTDNVVPAHSQCAMEYSYAQQRKKRADMKQVELEVVDAKGNVLPGAYHKGKLHVAGDPNSEYGLRVRNLTHFRVEVVLTVDGRDVLTGKPGSAKATGYVLSPYQTSTIKGWRTSMSEVAAFEFADVSESYASKLGDASNVGVIGMAVYGERRVRKTRSYGGGQGLLRSCSASTRRLGTAFGEAKESKVSKTSFVRSSLGPVQKVAVIYNTREALEAQGVKLPTSKEPNPFPADGGFCKAPEPAQEEDITSALAKLLKGRPDTTPREDYHSPFPPPWKTAPPWKGVRGQDITCEGE